MNKSDFPIFDAYPNLVYLDNAATSQKPQVVIDAISDFYKTSNANVHRGIHKLAEKATLAYEDSRQIVAHYLNAKSNEVVFTSGTTESINIVSNMLYLENKHQQRGKTILVTEMEHHSNILPWQYICKELGWNIEYVGLTKNFELDLEDLRNKLNNNDVTIFAFTHMSNVLGTINDVSEICRIVKDVSREITTVVDGAQYVPHSRFDLGQNQDIDFYAFSGHKMLGPTGIGVLFGREELLNKLEPVKRGGGMISIVNKTSSTWASSPEKFEAGTPNIADTVGLGSAIKYINNFETHVLRQHMSKLTSYTYEKLSELSEIKLFGPQININRGPVFSFTVEGIHPHDLAQILDQEDIAIRAGHHCTQILHREVLRIPASNRVSLMFYNSTSDIDRLSKCLKTAIIKFKK